MCLTNCHDMNLAVKVALNPKPQYNQPIEMLPNTEKKGYVVNPFPNGKFYTCSKLKKFADTNFKFDDNGRQFSIRVKTVEREKLLVTSNYNNTIVLLSPIYMVSHRFKQ